MRKINDKDLLQECRKRGYIVLGDKRPIDRALQALRRCDVIAAEQILSRELDSDVIAIPTSNHAGRKEKEMPLLVLMQK